MSSVGIMASAVVIAAGIDVLAEPFNDFTTAPWAVVSTPAIVTGRTGTAAEINSISDALNYNLSAPNQSDTITIGFAWRTSALQATGHQIVAFRSDTGATLHTDLRSDANGSLTVTRAGTAIGTPTANGTVTINTWHYIEFQARLGDSTGTAAVRVNGATVINATGLDTKNAGTKTVYDQVRLATPNSSTGGINQYDDLYLSVAGAPFKGDHTIP